MRLHLQRDNHERGHMFGRVLASAKSAIHKLLHRKPEQPKAHRYDGPLVPLRRFSRLAALLSVRQASGESLTALTGTHPHYYPEWHSRVKTKGKRDRSLRIRSNRRKAAR